MIYKITIEQIDRDEVEETKEIYVHKDTGEKLDWMEWHNLDTELQKEYETKRVGTGNREIVNREQKVYEQEKADLDIAELAIFINRAR